jgi:hypothetical protein
MFLRMKRTATKLANDGKAVLDRITRRRHGKTVAKIQRKAGANRQEMAELLKGIRFSNADTKELKKAMDSASKVFGCAGGD